MLELSLSSVFSFIEKQRHFTTIIKQLPRINLRRADPPEIHASSIKPAMYCIHRHIMPTLPYTYGDAGNGFVDRSQRKEISFTV